MTIGSKVEYARHRKVSPALVTRWFQAGRLVMEGKKVVFEASDAALAASLSPTHGGRRVPGGAPVAASSNAAQDTSPRGDGRGLPGARPNTPQGPSYLHAKTRQADVAAELLEDKLRRSRGELAEVSAYEAAIAAALAAPLAKLDSLFVRIAPQLAAAGGNIRRIQDIGEDELAKVRQEMADNLRALVRDPRTIHSQ